MNPADFVYRQIYTGALRAGATERAAHSQAVMGLDRYKRGKNRGTVSKLIEEHIKLAKKQKG